MEIDAATRTLSSSHPQAVWRAFAMLGATVRLQGLLRGKSLMAFVAFEVEYACVILGTLGRTVARDE